MDETRRAIIVGVGLIGGSVGLALRGDGWHVIGVDRDESRLADAVSRGVIDRTASIDDLPACDLAIVSICFSFSFRLKINILFYQNQVELVRQ